MIVDFIATSNYYSQRIVRERGMIIEEQLHSFCCLLIEFLYFLEIHIRISVAITPLHEVTYVDDHVILINEQLLEYIQHTLHTYPLIPGGPTKSLLITTN